MSITLRCPPFSRASLPAPNAPPRSSGKPVPLCPHPASDMPPTQNAAPAFRIAPESHFPTLANTARSARRCQEQKWNIGILRRALALTVDFKIRPAPGSGILFRGGRFSKLNMPPAGGCSQGRKSFKIRPAPGRSILKLVPGRGLEPPRPCDRQHLKLVRLPIPPSGHYRVGRRG
jgi:hypothetical protein